jgi:cytochrome b6-f complex iron-sulfur subunit
MDWSNTYFLLKLILIIMKRRDFLNKSIKILAISPLAITMLNSCEKDEVYIPTSTNASKVNINISDYPGLLNIGGVVEVMIKGKNNNDPVILSRINENEIVAFSSVCRHQGCIIQIPKDTTGDIECPCHYIKYSPIDGSIVYKPMSEDIQPLIKFATTFDNISKILIINI